MMCVCVCVCFSLQYYSPFFKASDFLSENYEFKFKFSV